MIGVNWDYSRVIKREYNDLDKTNSSLVLRFFRQKDVNAIDPAGDDILLDEIECTPFEAYRIAKVIRENIRFIDRVKYFWLGII